MYNKILSLVQSGKNIFITGAAGVGKSFYLNQLKQDLPDLVVTATTGVAAINVEGFTIHSFSGIGIGNRSAKQTAYSMHPEQKLKIIHCSKLAIDEISMLNADIFDLINEVFKIVRYKYSNLPFGGIQLIVIGDFLQLPPVEKDGKEPKFAFESVSWKEANFQVVNLTEQHRQKDTAFIEELNKIRLGEMIEITSTSIHDNALHLFALNHFADEYNKNKLNEIKGQIYHFEARDSGNPYNIASIDKNCLVPRNLYLKIGARVMLLINKYIEIGLINGSIGNITKINNNTVTVQFDNGANLDLFYEKVAKIMGTDTEYHSYPKEVDGKTILESTEIKKENKIELASRTQIPLRLAYAVSIHKAQGLSLDKVCIDFSGTFESGQAYVALSRVRSKTGLSVKNLRPNLIKANKKAVEFYKNMSKQNERR